MVSPSPHPGRAPLVDGPWLPATIAAALVIGHQVGSKTLRDALFLSSFPSSELPKIMGAAAATSLLLAVLAGRLMRKLGPYRLVPIALLINAGVFVLESGLLAVLPRGVAILLYLHVAGLGALLVSGFWSVISERFDPHAARRLVGRIGAGATLGGVLGALAAELVARYLGPHAVMLVLAGASSCAAIAIRRLAPTEASPSPASASPIERAPDRSAAAMIRARPYLWTLAALTIAAAVWEALLDYAMKASVAAELTDRAELVSYFAAYYTATAVVTFVVQAALCSLALRKLGLTWTVAILPAFVVVAGAGAAGVGALAAIIGLRTGEAVLSNSLYRAGHELYFTPLPPEAKRPTKTLLDVATTRIGDGIGSVLVLLIVLWMPGHAAGVAIAGAALTGAAAILLLPRLHRGYVAALSSALRAGIVHLHDGLPLDATTRRTFSDTTRDLDRTHLLAQIGAFPGELAMSTAAKARALASGDDAALRKALAGQLEPTLVGLALPLLLRESVAADAAAAIHQVAARATGSLVDAMLDAGQPQRLRLLVPPLLAHAGTPRARDGLVAGIEDGEQEVRHACATALERMILGHPQLRPPPASILEWVRHELARTADRSTAHGDAVSNGTAAASRRLDPGVTQALALLSLALDREAISFAQRALASDDHALRGTAIEYLENVVDEPAKTPLLERLLQPRREPSGQALGAPSLPATDR